MPKLLYLTTQDKFFLSHIKERALYAKLNKFDVVVAVQQTNEDYVRKIKKMGFAFYDTGIERQSLNPFSQLKAIFKLVKLYKKEKPDLLHNLGAKAIIYGTLAHKMAQLSSPSSIVNAPIGLGYVYASNDLKATLLRPLLNFLYRVTLNPTDSFVIFENPDDLNYFVNIGALERTQSTCIYGAGVDTRSFCQSDLKNQICTVVMASRLIKEKGVFDFIKAAEILKKNSVPVRMQLVGEPDFGNPHSLSKQHFEDLQNNGAIECLGYQDDVASILKKAHICCLPSFYREGLPRFLIEGACCGLAVITTDTVGCREVVVDNNGYLIEPHNVDELVNKITELVENPSLTKEMGCRSRKVALKLFDKKLVCKQTYDIYEELLRQQHHLLSKNFKI